MKERPKCRMIIENKMQENGLTIEQVYDFVQNNSVSRGLERQVRKMYYEEKKIQRNE